MRILKLCDQAWGGAKRLNGAPDASFYNGVYYVPFRTDRPWGIFHQDGRIAEGSWDAHGPDGTHNIGLTLGVEELQNASVSADEPYIYGGNIHFHYGHFVVDTLSRHWVNLAKKFPRYRVLMHGPGVPAQWFLNDFVRDAFLALGISPERIVKFDEVTRLSNLCVPFPSFVGQKEVFTAYGDLCGFIGKQILNEFSVKRNKRPVYLTKAGMHSGVATITNETEVNNALEAGGVEIIYPERISLSEKIRLFAERECVAGIASSGMHTSVFWPSNARTIVLNVTPVVNSNFHLLDLLTWNDSLYVYPPGTRVPSSPDKNFLSSFELESPREIAADLLDLISAKSGI